MSSATKVVYMRCADDTIYVQSLNTKIKPHGEEMCQLRGRRGCVDGGCRPTTRGRIRAVRFDDNIPINPSRLETQVAPPPSSRFCTPLKAVAAPIVTTKKVRIANRSLLKNRNFSSFFFFFSI